MDINSHEITFCHINEAESALTKMREILDQYTIVTVADLHDLQDNKNYTYTDTTYGWIDLSGATVERDKVGKYYIKLPAPINLNGGM